MNYERKKRHSPYLEKQVTRWKFRSQKQLEGDLIVAKCIFIFPLFPYSLLLPIPVGNVNFMQCTLDYWTMTC